MEKKLQGIPNILIIDEACIEENPVAILQKYHSTSSIHLTPKRLTDWPTPYPRK